MDIVHLQYLIADYLHLRLSAFPNFPLRPKHHYLTHYPWAILHFGPLSYSSTLRFESKHSYFKRTIRNTKNFVNLCSSLAYSHQVLQACLLENGIFPPKVQISASLNSLVTGEITNIVCDCGYNFNACVFIKSIVYRGIDYHSSMYIVIEKQSRDLLLGEIQAIFLHAAQVHFVVYTQFAQYLPDFGVYHLCSDVNERQYKCIAISTLHNHVPLCSNQVGTNFFICLKQYIS